MASKSSKKCVICNRSRSVPDLFLAALPLDPIRCQQWVQAIGQQDLVDLPIEKLHQLKFVCAIHFAADDFNKNGNRLLKTAVPKFDLPFPPLPQEVFVDFPQRIGSQRVQFARGILPCPVKDAARLQNSVKNNGDDKILQEMDPDTAAEEHSSQMSPDTPAEELSSEIVPDLPEELKVCRICLALDVKMYNMEDWKLTEMFQNITGIQVSSDSPSILQRLCWECAARLTAAAAFRDKALLSDGLLQILLQAGDDVTKSDIISMKENHTSLKTALTIQKVFYTADEEEDEQDTPTDNVEIDNILHNNERKTYIRVNIPQDNQAHCPTLIREVPEKSAGVPNEIDNEMLEQHLIDIPTNDSDPIDDITNKDRISPLLEFVNFVKDSIVVNAVELDTAANPTDDCDTMKSESAKETYEITKVAVINEDGNIVLIDKKVKKHKIDEIDDTVSCEDNTLQPEAKKFKSKPVDIKTMKDKPGIKRKTKHRCTTAEQDRSIVDRVREEQTLHTASLAKEFGVSPRVVRARLREAGFKPATSKNTPKTLKKKQKMNTCQSTDEGTKQQVISSEQDGESVSEIARRLDTSSR